MYIKYNIMARKKIEHEGVGGYKLTIVITRHDIIMQMHIFYISLSHIFNTLSL